MLRTPNGVIDVRAIQQRAAAQVNAGTITDDVKMAIGLLATVTEELESRDKQLQDLRATLTY